MIGYNFTKQNRGGLGSIIYDILFYKLYCKDNNKTLVFTKEGYNIPRFNGGIKTHDIQDKYWHSYFDRVTVKYENECELNPDIKYFEKINIQKSSELLKNEIFILLPQVEEEVKTLVKNTNFNSETDIVLHIRLTDKITEVFCFISTEIYIKECEKILLKFPNEKNRIYICTDDKKICNGIKLHFEKKNIEVIWDYFFLTYL